ncbi:toxin-antitoxin system YwqK family antitoxin [Flavobacterium muglaense]|uniref:MORN repeat variant n=1 Tax=Flavobacterium muglaense TaxID=2764716 RepID=A0A923MZN1_9FLAO|nr:hypothetical protein [Flavobacterium muglaense]MBC5836926.1 hypothetical protein [Flavobacterium muglaense]MBC5843455.1 hypothetical protein [Flavobacterium muglaense]
MKKLTFLFIIILSLNSCKVKTNNQTVHKKREGLWIETYALDSAHYKSIGTYKDDDPVKKWRYYLNSQLIKKERYHKTYCKTKLFHQNRKKQAKGITKLDIKDKDIHWYYSGTWKYYNSNGQLITTRTYNKGDLISETNN